MPVPSSMDQVFWNGISSCAAAETDTRSAAIKVRNLCIDLELGVQLNDYFAVLKVCKGGILD